MKGFDCTDLESSIESQRGEGMRSAICHVEKDGNPEAESPSGSDDLSVRRLPVSVSKYHNSPADLPRTGREPVKIV